MPVKVKVLYFALARDAAGRSTESLSLDGAPTAGALLETLVESHPRLRPLKPSIRLSVNQELVTTDAPLHDGDEVGVLPPVAGG